jgi:hypothetical protein
MDRTGADNQQETGVLPADNLFDDFAGFKHGIAGNFRQGKLLFQHPGRDQRGERQDMKIIYTSHNNPTPLFIRLFMGIRGGCSIPLPLLQATNRHNRPIPGHAPAPDRIIPHAWMCAV